MVSVEVKNTCALKKGLGNESQVPFGLQLTGAN
ncbi:MAG: hypothetical protein ACI9G1_003968 [Pirellulaceae bacterium]|jgi:hypothetical protein